MEQTPLVFMKGKRKYLIFTDHVGALPALPLIQKLVEHNCLFEWRTVSTFTDAAPYLIDWLSSQTIGSYLYLAGIRELIEKGREAAYEAGYSDDELQTYLVDDANTRIFCVVCEQTAFVPSGIQAKCPHCDTLLSVTDHFSPRLQAYLAYTPISIETKAVTR